jgi:tetratricopeptide (TPR) repeat protein
MNTHNQNKIISVVFLVLMSGPAARAQRGTVSATESSVEIPTYTLGSEDPNPPFQLLNEHEIYPYTMLDDLTDDRAPRSYKAIILENEYLRATILPELGGRLYSIYDKIAKREVFYRNRSVKYGLVALRGAWISGGIEFNFPNGHSTDTVSPVSSRFQVNPDGSATVFVGDIDQVSEMYWEVALTLRPGTARLEQHVTLFNPTPVEHLYWYWNNAAVRATEDARFIYPMRLAAPGLDSDLQTFPEWHGVDYSRYASFHEPSEFFGMAVHRNFFGVYYEDAKYGVVHYADHREVTGKKFWTWGVAGDGTIWTDLLTDADGPYNEIQAGRFETQFNREFMPAQTVEAWTEYWYPVNQLDGGFVDATEQLAMNVNIVPTSGGKGDIHISVSPTEHVAHASIQISLDGKIVKSFRELTFDPAATRTFVIPDADIKIASNKTSVELFGDSGKLLLHWSAAEPVDGNADLVSRTLAAVSQTLKKGDLSVEEMYLNGVLEDKRGNHEVARQLFEQVLKRDPNYIPVLRKLAIQAYLGGDFDAAKKKIERAVLQDKSDGETQYGAGIICRASGDTACARDALWSSVRSEASLAPALVQLGEIALSGEDYASAEELLRRALSYVPDDVLAQSDLSVALRLNGKAAEAAELAGRAVKMMPLYPPPLAERWRLSALKDRDSIAAREAHNDWSHAVGHRMQSYLEAGSWYWGLNDYDSSDFIFEAAVREFASTELSPLVYYYMASNARHRGRDEEAVVYATKARSSGLDRIFIDRLSDVAVLQEALLSNSGDAHAQYLLGNYMFQHRRYEEAEHLWLQAQRSGLEYSVLYRDLGVSAWKVKKDLNDAKSFYEKAIQLAPQDYRLYVDLDEIYAELGATEMRAKLFANIPPGLLDHDAVRVRYIVFLMKQGEYDHALSFLNNHRFKPWEQGADVREILVAANIQEGRRELSAKNFAKAQADITRSFEYPANLGVGRPDKPSDAAAHYWLGEVRSEQGDSEGASREWKMLTNAGAGSSDEAKYYAALALERLGQKKEATEILLQLAEGPELGRIGAHNYYVAGLADRHLGREVVATKYLRKALEMNPSLWQADCDFAQ